MLGELAVITITLVSAAMAAMAQYFFKGHIRKFQIRLSEIMELAKNRHIIAGVVIYVLSLIVYVYGLSKAPTISFVYPIFSSSFIFVLLISKYALKEKVGWVRIAGILLIVLGISAIALTYG